MPALTVHDNQLDYDGEPIQLISGAIHYFRVVPEYWEDRLLKLKACGFNTVETYIPWNIHEPQPGQFDFSGIADVSGFIQTAGELGLHVIARPSPYICAEWEFGGLPAWLLADKNMRIRSMDESFLQRVDQYYDVLMEKMKPLLSTNGGPIIAMQIENEYGSFGNDKDYLHYLREAMVQRGIDVLLFTSDGPTDFMLQGGTLSGELATVNFGSRPQEAFAKLKKYRPNSPFICMEYWNGWFDHWGEEHHQRSHSDAAETFSEMLQMGASVNFYMFHGGTNFGFYNGANFGGEYQPTVTSYDYDCPLSESGGIMPKFHAVREAISQHHQIGELTLPKPILKKAYGQIELSESMGLFESLFNLAEPVMRTHPEPMEKLGQNYGFILYHTTVSGPRENVSLHLQDVHDRALIFVNDEYRGVIDRWDEQTVSFNIPIDGIRLDILVENMGRVNYGPYFGDTKGITEGVRLDQQFLYNWAIYPLPLDDLSSLEFNKDSNTSKPAFFKGEFEVGEIADTFLELSGWTKGVAYINGFNLGRYWNIGPQKTLYVPGPLLQDGKNELVVFELHATDEPIAQFCDTADLG